VRPTRTAGLVTGLLAAGVLASCTGPTAGPSGRRTPTPPPSSVAAFPRSPRVAGPVPVTLQPGLRLLGTATCRPAAQVYCVDDEGYRALGDHAAATVREVVARPSRDHGSWRTVVRFAPGSGPAVRSTTGTARALGGAVVVLRGRVPVAVVAPPDVRLAGGEPTVRFLGLQKAEAWALVDAFGPS
jgi:hypothetical protein